MSFLYISHPEIFQELSTVHNATDLYKVTSGSGMNLVWVCNKNHEYFARVFNRVKGSNCPFCAGIQPLSGVNDLKTLHPDIHKYLKDSTLVLLPSSGKVVEWVCDQNHIIKTAPKSFIKNKTFRCKICAANQKPITPLTSNAILTKEYSAKNSEPADAVALNSNKKVWWICDKGHEWEAQVKNRNNGRGCPTCAGRKQLTLQESHPELVKEWVDAKNPENYTSGSTEKVQWNCGKGHTFTRKICDRTHPALNQHKPCPYCTNRIVDRTNAVNFTHPQLTQEFKNQEEANNYTYGSEKKIIWVCDKGHEWEAQIKSRTSENSGCPKCISSQGEKDLRLFLTSLNLQHISNTRKIIPPYELDFYIPSTQVAIEFNGTYWHSEKFKTPTYHYDKWLAAKNAGIQLIQVWEDDWNYNPGLMKRMLANKLGVSQEAKVYARNTRIKNLTTKETELFLNLNHIQGFVVGSYYVGLTSRDTAQILAVMVLKKEGNLGDQKLSLLRYATAQPILGGFSKLLNHVEETYSPKKIVTFSDNCVSHGNLYETNGFIATKNLPPDYTYLIQGSRKHKFGYRLRKFREDPNLLWKPGLTEKQLAELNSLLRIWDAGKIRWEKTYS